MDVNGEENVCVSVWFAQRLLALCLNCHDYLGVNGNVKVQIQKFHNVNNTQEPEFNRIKNVPKKNNGDRVWKHEANTYIYVCNIFCCVHRR